MANTLPNTFVLKSSNNNKYLAYIKEEGEVHGLLKFSAEDVSELTVFEVEPAAKAGNGMVHVKCCYNNKYWRRWSPSHWWMAAQADEPEEDQSKWSCTLFRPNFVDGDPKSLQLIHVQLGHYACSWRVAEPFSYWLCAGGSNPDHDKLDILTITELVPRSREIKDVEFNLKAAKLYDQTTVQLGQALPTNNGFNSNQVIPVTINFVLEEKRTWKAKSWLNSELVATCIDSAMPVVVNGKTELTGGELTGPYRMGKTMVTRETGKTKYNIVVQPRTQVIVNLKATEAVIDVPFTFTRRDTLSDNKVLTFNNNDGMHTGVTHFNLRFEAEERSREA